MKIEEMIIKNLPKGLKYYIRGIGNEKYFMFSVGESTLQYPAKTLIPIIRNEKEMNSILKHINSVLSESKSKVSWDTIQKTWKR